MMRRMYQTSWQGIRFADFSRISSRELAGPAFYDAFYTAFFSHYRGWNDLDPAWRENKAAIARFIRNTMPPTGRVLSIGCGLGYVEHCLLAETDGQLALEVEEMAAASLKWLQQELPEERIHRTGLPAREVVGDGFDLIYLSAVDYALDDTSLISILAGLRASLRLGGRCLVISASFVDVSNPAISVAQGLKDFLADLLDRLGLRTRGQFWGWGRNRAEYQDVMRRAGYEDTLDGFIDADSKNTYWISGR